MQDNRYHISDDFIEQSWQNMKEVLNKEMPIKKTRSWWVFILGLIIILGSFGYFSWQKMDENRLKPVELVSKTSEKGEFAASSKLVAAEKEEMISTKEKSGNQNFGIIAAGINENEKNQTAVNKADVNADFVETYIPDDFEENVINQLPIISNDISHHTLLIRDENIALQSDVSNSDLADKNPPIMSEGLLNSQSSDQLDSRVPLFLSSLPGIEFKSLLFSYINILELPNISTQIQTIPLKKHPALTKYGVGVFGAVLSQEWVKTSGFDVGLRSYWNLNESWKILGSIGYNQLNFDVTEQEYLDAAAGVGLDMDSSLVAAPVLLNYSSADNLITRASYFYGQFELGYKAVPNVWFTGGIRASKLFHANNKELFISSPVLESNQLTFNSAYLDENGFIKSWDIGFIAGVEWQILPHLSFACQYHYGLGAIMPKEPFELAGFNIDAKPSKYQRFVKLGINIYL